MRVALVHDYLNQYGGAERVLETLLKLFPGADVYTLLYSPERTSAQFRQKIRKTSILDFPLARHHHRLFIPFMPYAVRTLEVGDRYDLLISDSAGYAKGVPYRGNAFHLSYCYTPLRYAWEIDTYFENPAFKTLFRPVFAYLRRWDFAAAQKPDAIVAVSEYIAGKVRRYYGRTANVAYPPVDYGKFQFEDDLQPLASGPSYYLAAGRLMHYKKFPLLVRSFLELGLNLKLVGIGPDYAVLKRMANGAKNIELIPFVSDDQLRVLYNGAKALLFPQAEDFGLVAAEAQACGAPVIAYAEGGALEIVREGVTGIFFREQSVSGIVEAVRRLERMIFDRRQISVVSRRFTLDGFREGLMRELPPSLRAGFS